MAPVNAVGAPERMLQRKIGPQNNTAISNFQGEETSGCH
jgi:hypothetical protein